MAVRRAVERWNDDGRERPPTAGAAWRSRTRAARRVPGPADGPPSRTAGPRCGRSRSARWGLTVLSALLLSAARVALSGSLDDSGHVESKARYLESLGKGGRRRGAERRGHPVRRSGRRRSGRHGTGPIRTPALDRLAAEGIRFRQAYSPSPYCSASRAALLTGRHAVRSGLDHVLQPAWTWADLLLRLGGRNRRLPAEEITLPEILSAAGWSTAMVGKWHLGDEAPSRPIDRGSTPTTGCSTATTRAGRRVARRSGRRGAPDRPVVADRALHRRGGALRGGGRRRPSFFLYLSHTFPHIPLHVAGDRLGRSPGGLYGDVVEELDRSVGRVLEGLRRSGREEETLVIVTSDNGPWFQGSPGSHRGRKLGVFEGGMRVPLLARWTGTVEPGGVVDDPVSGLDLLPTILGLAGLAAPPDRLLDGLDLSGLLLGAPASPAAEREILYFQIGELRALRQGRYKLHDRRRVVFGNPMNWPWGPYAARGPWLFDLELDPSESYDVGHHHPEVADRLGRRFAQRRAELRDDPRGWLRSSDPPR